jgi:hypothetical protein
MNQFRYVWPSSAASQFDACCYDAYMFRCLFRRHVQNPVWGTKIPNTVQNDRVFVPIQYGANTQIESTSRLNRAVFHIGGVTGWNSIWQFRI